MGMVAIWLWLFMRIPNGFDLRVDLGFYIAVVGGFLLVIAFLMSRGAPMARAA